MKCVLDWLCTVQPGPSYRLLNFFTQTSRRTRNNGLKSNHGKRVCKTPCFWKRLTEQKKIPGIWVPGRSSPFQSETELRSHLGAESPVATGAYPAVTMITATVPHSSIVYPRLTSPWKTQNVILPEAFLANVTSDKIFQRLVSSYKKDENVLGCRKPTEHACVLILLF